MIEKGVPWVVICVRIEDRIVPIVERILFPEVFDLVSRITAVEYILTSTIRSRLAYVSITEDKQPFIGILLTAQVSREIFFISSLRNIRCRVAYD